MFATASAAEWRSSLGWMATFFLALWVLGALVAVPLYAVVYLLVASRERMIVAARYGFVCWLFIYAVSIACSTSRCRRARMALASDARRAEVDAGYAVAPGNRALRKIVAHAERSSVLSTFSSSNSSRANSTSPRPLAVIRPRSRTAGLTT